MNRLWEFFQRPVARDSAGLMAADDDVGGRRLMLEHVVVVAKRMQHLECLPLEK